MRRIMQIEEGTPRRFRLAGRLKISENDISSNKL